jgi:magnesium-transporting ATPase (P-type)
MHNTLTYTVIVCTSSCILTSNRYKLLGRNTTSITTEVNGVKRQVTVIAVNKFDSDRKRMSVIIKEDNGTIRLLCKVCV